MKNENAKFTPGPWTLYKIISPYGNYHSISKLGCDSMIATTASRDCEEANARLIAAAPELLAALEWVADALNTEAGDLYKAHIEQARAIIKRAKGE